MAATKRQENPKSSAPQVEIRWRAVAEARKMRQAKQGGLKKKEWVVL